MGLGFKFKSTITPRYTIEHSENFPRRSGLGSALGLGCIKVKYVLTIRNRIDEGCELAVTVESLARVFAGYRGVRSVFVPLYSGVQGPFDVHTCWQQSLNPLRAAVSGSGTNQSNSQQFVPQNGTAVLRVFFFAKQSVDSSSCLPLFCVPGGSARLGVCLWCVIFSSQRDRSRFVVGFLLRQRNF